MGRFKGYYFISRIYKIHGTKNWRLGGHLRYSKGENKMKQFLLGYRHPAVKLYAPKVNRKRQVGLLSLMLGDIVLPMTFGVGFIITKQILKLKPLFLYK